MPWCKPCQETLIGFLSGVWYAKDVITQICYTSIILWLVLLHTRLYVLLYVFTTCKAVCFTLRFFLHARLSVLLYVFYMQGCLFYCMFFTTCKAVCRSGSLCVHIFSITSHFRKCYAWKTTFIPVQGRLVIVSSIVSLNSWNNLSLCSLPPNLASRPPFTLTSIKHILMQYWTETLCLIHGYSFLQCCSNLPFWLEPQV